MARLPKSIIKKYGISKKAWSVYRGKSRSKTRKASTRRSSAKVVRRKRRKSYSRSGFKAGIKGVAKPVMWGFGIGLAREPVNQKVRELMPGGLAQYSDEVVIGGLALAGAVLGKGMIREASMHVLECEAYSAARQGIGSVMQVSAGQSNNGYM